MVFAYQTGQTNVKRSLNELDEKGYGEITLGEVVAFVAVIISDLAEPKHAVIYEKV